MGNSVDMMMFAKGWLSRLFSMKDLRDATYILGIRLYKNRVIKLLDLSWRLYIDIEKMLKRFSTLNFKRG